jgi:hypothetical protein
MGGTVAMHPLLKAVVSGLAATLVLSGVMTLKARVGLLPELDVIALLAAQLGHGEPAVGWLMHYAIGIGYGLVFAATGEHLPGGGAVGRAMVLATSGWLLMMIVLLPGAGVGFFGSALGLGVAPAVVTLVLHWIFGAVLGLTHRAFA